MARFIASLTTLTPTAVADTTGMTDQTYPFVIQGGSSTQVNYIWEVSITGQAASSSSPTFMLLARDSTVGATPGTDLTGLTTAALDGSTAALAAPVAVHDAFTTKPQRSSTLHLLNCSLNAYGGNFFWRANRVEECVKMLGNTASLGEVSLSAFTGGTPGAIGTHVIYESM